LTALQIKQGHQIHYINIGEMIGHQNLAEQNGVFMSDIWKFDIYAETDGMMAMLPYGEVKVELRRQPKAMYRVIEIAAN
jgi:hypothetical protein